MQGKGKLAFSLAPKKSASRDWPLFCVGTIFSSREPPRAHVVSYTKGRGAWTSPRLNDLTGDKVVRLDLKERGGHARKMRGGVEE